MLSHFKLAELVRTQSGSDGVPRFDKIKNPVTAVPGSDKMSSS